MLKSILNWFAGPATPRQLHTRADTPATHGPRQVNPTSYHYFEALRESADRSPIPAIALAWNWKTWMQSLNRERLGAVARYLYDNHGAVSYTVDTMATYSTPIIPHAASPNPDWNARADAYFANWSKRADFTGRFTFDDLQRLACKGIDIEGDDGVTVTTENGFPQVQLFESWRIGSPLQRGEGVIDGVRVDKKGRVLGYDIYDQTNKIATIPVAQFKLNWDADRYASYRGYTPMRRGSNDIRDSRDIQAFEKLATKVGSAVAAVIQSDGPLRRSVWGDEEDQDNQPPADATEQEKRIGMAELLGGDIPVLPPGQTFNQLQNNRPGDRVPDFLLFLIGSMIWGLGLPPAFLLDKDLTGPNQRSVNGKAQRKFDNRQLTIAGMVEFVWQRVMGFAIANNELPSQVGYDILEYTGPAKVSIDAGREMAQEREDVFHALMSRQNHFANRQLNWRRETDQSFSEDRYILRNLKAIAKEEDVPFEMLAERYGYGGAKAMPEETAQPTSQPTSQEQKDEQERKEKQEKQERQKKEEKK